MIRRIDHRQERAPIIKIAIRGTAAPSSQLLAGVVRETLMVAHDHLDVLVPGQNPSRAQTAPVDRVFLPQSFETGIRVQAKLARHPWVVGHARVEPLT